MMANYLLIHGAMRGAWLWDKLMPLLMKGGGNPIAIDLPGHGDRKAESAGVTMSSYIDDVIQFIRRENLKDLVLVGHSMSGIVISKLAEEIPERIKHLVYLAAVVPKDNEALIDLLTKERQETLRKLQGKVKEVFGTLEQLRPMYFTDQEGEEKESYLEQLTPQPLAAFLEKIRFSQFPKIDIPKTYILGLRDKSLPPDLTRKFAERLGVIPVEIDAGHDMMVSRPEEVAKVLLAIA
jgi:pimeloyl-ACP methyl ester carboxylesterase